MTDDKPYPRFVTNRSPSFERAQAEHEHPTPSGDAQAVAVLARLFEAEDEARRACVRVATMMEDESLAEDVRNSATEHAARSLTLGDAIRALGGAVPRPEEGRGTLMHGPDSMLRGASDRETLQALAPMRDELVAAYENALGTQELDDQQRAALAQLASTIPSQG